MSQKVKVKEVSSCEKELRIEVPKALVEAEFETVFGKLAKQVQIPGFRKGKAPRNLVAQHHGEQAREEVLRSLVSRTLKEALKPYEAWDLVGHPQVDEVELKSNAPMTYVARVEVAPQIDPGRYKGLKLTAQKIQVKPKQLDDVLARIQDAQAVLKPIEQVRPAQAGDYLLADVTEKVKAKPPKTQKDQIIWLNLDNDPKGFLKQLVGLEIGAKREIPVKEYNTVVEVDLKEIKGKQLPPLDDALAKGLGKFESLSALKEQVTRDLEVQLKDERRKQLELQMVQALLERWKFDVPPSMVGEHARRILQERATELMRQGMPQQEVQNQAKALEDQAKLDALKQVKLYFGLRRIAELENLFASSEEIEQRMSAAAQSMEIPVDQFRTDLESRRLTEDFSWGITRSKVLDFLINEATIKEQS